MCMLENEKSPMGLTQAGCQQQQIAVMDQCYVSMCMNDIFLVQLEAASHELYTPGG